MEWAKGYLLSIIAAAMICSLITAMIPSAKGKQWIQLLSGIVLAITVMRPFMDADTVFSRISGSFSIPETASITESAEKMASDAMAEIIKRNTEAYILDKAKAMDVTLTVNVTVSSDRIPVPMAVMLSGNVQPYARLQIESMIQTDLGITREKIQWMQ